MPCILFSFVSLRFVNVFTRIYGYGYGTEPATYAVAASLVLYGIYEVTLTSLAPKGEVYIARRRHALAIL